MRYPLYGSRQLMRIDAEPTLAPYGGPRRQAPKGRKV